MGTALFQRGIIAKETSQDENESKGEDLQGDCDRGYMKISLYAAPFPSNIERTGRNICALSREVANKISH